MSPQLEIRGLRVRIDGRALLDIEELVVDAGNLAVIVGGAGSGKTVLARALSGDVASQGEVRAAGRLLAGPPSRRASSGLAAGIRDGERIAGCTVRESLQLAARRGSRAAESLEHIPQLGSRADLPAELLSGGEQQLLQVACAWCAAQPVLVLDSPTVGLAADAADIIRSLAVQEAAAGTSVLWLEHDHRAAPGPPAGVLVRGRLSEAESTPAA